VEARLFTADCRLLDWGVEEVGRVMRTSFIIVRDESSEVGIVN
jgi:hypothetical protein